MTVSDLKKGGSWEPGSQTILDFPGMFGFISFEQKIDYSEGKMINSEGIFSVLNEN